jgi:hypothetical protein
VQENCKKGFPLDRAESFLEVKFDENGRRKSAAYSKFSEMHLPKMKPDLS